MIDQGASVASPRSEAPDAAAATLDAPRHLRRTGAADPGADGAYGARPAPPRPQESGAYTPRHLRRPGGRPAAPTAPGDDGAPPDTFRQQVAGGVRWGLIASVATQAGRLGFVVVLMRLLGPENFGIVGQASVYIAVTYIFLHLGTAANIIQRPQLSDADVGSAWWINVALGTTLATATLVTAPLLAGFFRTEELTAVLRVLAICFVLKAMAVVPTALLYRAMRFRVIGTAEIVSTFVGGTCALLAAANGAGYWSLVVQTVTMDAIYLAALVRRAGLPSFTWSASAARGLWSFSSRVMGAELVKFLSENSDKFLVARVLGATQLGFYSLAYRVLQLPLLMMEQAGRVILPAFSRVQDDRARLGRLFLQASEAVSLVVSPAMTLAILCAPIVVPAVLGEAWTPAVVPLQILAAMTIQYLILSVTPAVLLATGRADWEFRWSMFTMAVALVAFALGVQGGITGVAWSYLAMGLVLTPVRLLVVGRLVPVSLGGYARILAPAAASTAALCVGWLAVAGALRGTTGGLPLAMCASAAGLAAYLVAARVLWPHDVRHQLEFARLVIRGGRT